MFEGYQKLHIKLGGKSKANQLPMERPHGNIDENEVDCAQSTVQDGGFSAHISEQALSTEQTQPSEPQMTNRRASIATSLGKETGSFSEENGEDPSYLRAVQALDLSPDEVIESTHGVWLITSVMNQGRMFLTNKAVYFHANLPYYSAEVLKAGTLRMRQRGTLHATYNKYWFILRQDSFCYCANSTDTIAVLGTIDLVTTISAQVSEKDPRVFIVETEEKVHVFKADSANSAHDWCKHLTREIFRVRNSGPCVRVRIPIANILRVDRSTVVPVDDLHLLILSVIPEKGECPTKYVFGLFHDADTTTTSFKSWLRKAQDANNIAHDSDGSVVLAEGKAPGITQPIEDSSFHRRQMEQAQSTERSKGLLERGVRFESLYTDNLSTRSSAEMSPLPSPCAQSPAISRESSSAHIPVLGAINKGIKTIVEEVPLTNTVQKAARSLIEEPASVLRPTESDATGSSHQQQQADNTEVADISPEKFRRVFSFGPHVELLRSYVCYFYRNHQPHFGRVCISDEFLCFQRLHSNGKAPSEGHESLVIVPWRDIESINKLKHDLVARHGYYGIEIILANAESFSFEFRSKRSVKDFLYTVADVDEIRSIKQFELMGTFPGEQQNTSYAVRFARLNTYEQAVNQMLGFKIPPVVLDPLITNVREPFLSKPHQTLTITMLTIGSRGDIQPYIALSQGLMAEGHKCRIVTHAEYKEWVEGFGIEFAAIAGDPKDLMQIMIEHGGFSYTFLREANQKFSGWLDELLESAWIACQGSDLLIESPSAMAGLHIAEALKIPYYRAFTMPWTRTRAYPHAFIVPDQPHSGGYNYLTYVLFDKMFWLGIGSHINSWRTKTLKLPRTSFEQMKQQDIPFLYSVSPHVLPPTMDQPDWVHVTGYWMMNNDLKNFKPDPKLVEFIEKARADNVALVYIGFGSIIVKDPAALSKAVIEGVQQAKVRAIIAKGWSEKGTNKTDGTKFPPEIFNIDQCPHDWLFPQVDAAVHHGGSGTTGMSLTCGLPTIIKPFFGDQFFYAQRVEELEVGRRLQKLTANTLSRALVEATTSKEMIAKAKALGDSISHEHGVQTAIATIYRELPYANSRVGKSPDSGTFASKILEKPGQIIENSIDRKLLPRGWAPSLWNSLKGTASSTHGSPDTSPTLVPVLSNEENIDPLKE